MGQQRWPLFHALAGLRCPVGVVQDAASVLEDPQLASRGYFVETSMEGRGLRAPGAPAVTNRSLWRHRRPAPDLGGDPGPGWEETSGGPGDPAATVVPEAPAPASPSPSRSRAAVPAAAEAPSVAVTPLAGLRVLSFGQAWSGAFGSELLGLLGADVVQVSSLTHHDSWRRAGAPVPAAITDPARTQHPLDTQGLFNSVNLTKRELALDLAQEEGRTLLWDLIPHFDVLVDNFRPTVMENWGITFERLNQLHPGVVWASISGYGASGPYADYPAIGATIEPMSGLSSLHGYEQDQAINTGGLYPDPVSGYFLAAFVLAALRECERTGASQRIDLSMMEATAAVCGEALVGYGATRRVPVPTGNHHLRMAPHNLYQGADGTWLALAVESDAAWDNLVRLVDDPRLHDRRFASSDLRKHDEEALDRIMSEWCAGATAAERVAALSASGVAAALVRSLPQLYICPDEELIARGFVTSIDHPEVGPSWLPGAPWRFAGRRPPLSPAPCVGEHSYEVLHQELGIGPDAYRRLVATGVTGSCSETSAGTGPPG